MKVFSLRDRKVLVMMYVPKGRGYPQKNHDEHQIMTNIIEKLHDNHHL